MIYIELDDSQSPKAVKAVLNNLPIKVKVNTWGDEIYPVKMPIIVEEENAKSVVNSSICNAFSHFIKS
jgi:hypothetical protein